MNKFLEKFKRKLMRIPKCINNLVLCIRFPFLYPENAFDGTHFRWYWLERQISKLKRDSCMACSIRVLKPGDSKYDTVSTDSKSVIYNGYNFIVSDGHHPFKFDIVCNKDGDQAGYGGKKCATFDMRDLVEVPASSGKELYNGYYVTLEHVKYLASQSYWMYVKVPEDAKIDYYKVPRRQEFVYNTWKYNLARVLQKFHNTVLQWIMFIPGYTMLDGMPKGWRRAFGIQMCKDIKSQIIKDCGWKHLFKYKILQVKEKFATLRWYDGNSTEGIYAIIDKYEDLSYNTCCVCGKPATKLSRGWICPYCDECAAKEVKSYTDLYDSNNECPF